MYSSTANTDSDDASSHGGMMEKTTSKTSTDAKHALLDKIARLEKAAKRGIALNENQEISIGSGNLISVEQCEWTIRDCEIFRKWVTECL